MTISPEASPTAKSHCQDLRRAGLDRHHQRGDVPGAANPHGRASTVAGLPGCDHRRAEGDLFHRRAEHTTGVRHHPPARDDVVRRPVWRSVDNDGELVHLRAIGGHSPDMAAAARAAYPKRLSGANLGERAIVEGQPIYIRDYLAEPDIGQTFRNMDHRSIIAVPLLRDGVVIGAISVGSGHVDGITQAQLELLKTFAEQAVIAIGTTATFRALQTRTADLQELLEYQTATGDVLKVISRSTFDLQPVLSTDRGSPVRCRAGGDQPPRWRRLALRGEFWFSSRIRSSPPIARANVIRPGRAECSGTSRTRAPASAYSRRCRGSRLSGGVDHVGQAAHLTRGAVDARGRGDRYHRLGAPASGAVQRDLTDRP